MLNIQKRSVYKAITWRVIASAITFSLAWLATGQLKLSLLVGGTDALIKMVFYYYHEVLWDKFAPAVGKIKRRK